MRCSCVGLHLIFYIRTLDLAKSGVQNLFMKSLYFLLRLNGV